jgi:hypothetical protein
MAASRTRVVSRTYKGNKVRTETSNRKGPSKGKVITSKSGEAIGRSSPGRITRITIRKTGSPKGSATGGRGG